MLWLARIEAFGYNQFMNKTLALSLITLLSLKALAHNQNPATVKKSVAKAFESLGSEAPKQVFKGQSSVKLPSAKLQVFEAKSKEGQNLGQIFTLEFDEKFYAVASSNEKKEITAVLEDGTNVSKDSWEQLPFISQIKERFSLK